MEQIEASIKEFKLPPVHAEKMREDLRERGEFHFGMGLYHINKRNKA